MELAGSQKIKLYMQTQVITGNIHYTPTPEGRLSDALNGISQMGPVIPGRFLELTDVTVRNADGGEEKLDYFFVNKSTVQLAVTLGGADSGRGIGGNKGSRPYPFVKKSPLSVVIKTQDYIINGDMYFKNYQSVWQVLEDTPIFLPLTNVQVRTLAKDASEVFPFAVVNKMLILSLKKGNAKNKAGEEPTIAKILREDNKQSRYQSVST
jgi:hypothetical protein